LGNGLHSGWLLLVVNSCIGKWKEETSKLTVQNIKADQLYETLIPFPPLAEQHRIVAKVDELMALCDRLEATQTEREAARDRLATSTLARLNTPDPATFPSDARFALDTLESLTTRTDLVKQLRETIISLAVTGKLASQDPEDEPASQLLRRIEKEKRGLKSRARQPEDGEFIELSSRPTFELPDNWRWTSLGAICLEMRYGTSKKCDYGIVGTPVLRIPNVSGGKISIDDLKFGPLTESKIEDLSQRWPEESGRRDKWTICLNAAKMTAVQERA
jgi:type I restriction enzyme S subunit